MSKRTDRKREKARRHPTKPELAEKAGTAPRELTPEQQAKRDAAERRRVDRERERATGHTAHGTVVRMRAGGAGGLAVLYVLAWAIVALVLLAGWLLDRWNTTETADTLWLYVLIGMFAATPAVARLGRSRSDVTWWVVQSGLVALGALVGEQILGSSCVGGNCEAVGARGVLGFPIAMLLTALISACAWGLGAWMNDRAVAGRPSVGRTPVKMVVGTVVGITLMIGLPVITVAITADTLLRQTPQHAKLAVADVARYCFAVDETVPELAVRSYPDSEATWWTTFLVRNVDESRKTVTAKGTPTALPTTWDAGTAPQPYEAIVSFDTDAGTTTLQCRLISERAGTAKKEDVVDDTSGQNPLDTPIPGTSSPSLIQQPAAAAPAVDR